MVPSSRSRSGKQPRDPLSGFRDHTLDVVDIGGNQANGDCPLCGKKRKFYINTLTGSWDCKVCGNSGGLPQFLTLKTVTDQQQFRGAPALELSRDRGLKVQTLRQWRVGWDGYQYTIPSDIGGKLYDLRRYRIGSRVRATTGTKLSFCGIADLKSDVIWLCEGEWDGMTMTEVLATEGQGGTVFATPGGNVLPDHTIPWFDGKEVKVLYDNDKTGRQGCARVYKVLHEVAKSLEFLQWPEGLPDGFDIRDLYLQSGTGTLSLVEKMLTTRVPGGCPEQTDETVELKGSGLLPEEVYRRYKKWLFLPDPEPLAVMYGTVLANRLDGEPVWLFFAAPPGGCKSELLMSLDGAPKITSISNFTSKTLLSGATGFGNTDPSLLPRLDGKVLIIKDITAITGMNTAEQAEIFGTLRDAYDGKIERGWGTGVLRRYKSRFGILAGATKKVEVLGREASPVGERFLKYYLPQPGNIMSGTAAIAASIDNIAKETKMRAELCAVSTEVLSIPVNPLKPPKLPTEIKNKIIGLAKWVAAMRGAVSRERYTSHLEFIPSIEIGTRLGKQLSRLAMGIALYHHRQVVTMDDYRIIVSVARSTAPDRVERIVKSLYLQGEGEFCSTQQVIEWVHLPSGTTKSVLEDLVLLGVVQHQTLERGSNKWRLSRAVLQMMRPLDIYYHELAWTGKRDPGKQNRQHKKVDKVPMRKIRKEKG